MGVLLVTTLAGGGVWAAATLLRTQLKRWLEAKVQELVARAGPRYLGGSACSVEEVHLQQGLGRECRVRLGGLRVGNLEPWQASQLLEAQEVVVGLPAAELLRALAAGGGGRSLRATRLQATGCRLTLEKSTSSMSSNMGSLLEELRAGASDSSEPCDGSCCRVRLGRFKVSDITLEATTTTHVEGNVTGTTYAVPDIDVADCEAAFGSGDHAHMVRALMSHVLSTALDSQGLLPSLGLSVVGGTLMLAEGAAGAVGVVVQTLAGGVDAVSQFAARGLVALNDPLDRAKRQPTP